jgi:hypothetical protein
MRWTEEGVDIRLDPKEYVPNHIAESAGHENENSQQR